MNGGAPPVGALGLGEAPESHPSRRPVAALSEGNRGNRRRAAVALGLVVLVVTATLSVYEIYFVPSKGTREPSYPSPPTGWATFRTAWSSVAHAFEGFANGSWTVRFAEGAAADAPWSPPAVLWDQTNPPDWDACAGQLSGVSTLTFWNSSQYPFSTSSTTFSSGSAPLWTFIFNGTGTSTFVVSWLRGQVIINGDLGPASPCFSLGPPWNGVFGSSGLGPVSPGSELDSNEIASAAIAEGPSAAQGHVDLVPVPPTPAFALYFPGPQSVPITVNAPNTWVVSYGECGMAGQLGSSFTLTDYLFNATTGVGNQWFSTHLTCSDAYYLLNMTRRPVLNPPSPSGVYREWNVTSSFLSSAIPPAWSPSDLSTSLLQWRVITTGNTGTSIPPAQAGCGTSSLNLSSCPAPSSGWYAVLLSTNGAWLDSYPTVANGTAWIVPGLQVADGDRMVLVGSAGLPSTATFQTVFDTEPTVYASSTVG